MHMFLWIGLQLAAETVQDLFGVQSVAQVREGRVKEGDREGDWNVRVMGWEDKGVRGEGGEILGERE